jgi:hypothetical protein
MGTQHSGVFQTASDVAVDSHAGAQVDNWQGWLPRLGVNRRDIGSFRVSSRAPGGGDRHHPARARYLRLREVQWELEEP